MKKKALIVTAPVLAVAALTITAAEANAELPAEKDGLTVVAGEDDNTVIAPHDPGIYPPYQPYVVPQPASTTTNQNDTTSEVVQTGAAALTGAALTLTATWLHRRRHPIPPPRT